MKENDNQSLPAEASRELLRAAERGDTQLLVKLLTKGAEVNAKDATGWTPLMLASVG